MKVNLTAVLVFGGAAIMIFNKPIGFILLICGIASEGVKQWWNHTDLSDLEDKIEEVEECEVGEAEGTDEDEVTDESINEERM